MSRYDRYVLSQYLLFFGFFALILVSIFWINRAVKLFDWLIADGQSIGAFLELSALSLPNLVRLVLPVAAFAATAWVTNRLTNESELTVLRATGSSPWQLARPALMFAVFAALTMAVLSHVLLPKSLAEIERREAELASSISARLLTAGQFVHPTKGVTFFVRAIDDDGTFRDVFVDDQRSQTAHITYTSDKAYLVQDGDTAHLILVEGMAQRWNLATNLLSITAFQDLSYELGAIAQNNANRTRRLREFTTAELLATTQQFMSQHNYTKGALTEQLHERFARSTISFVVVLIAASTLMLGSYSRFGVWKQLLGAFLLLIGLEALRGVVSAPVLNQPSLWPMMYIPSLIGLTLSAAFLYVATHPRWMRRSSEVTT